uniref:Uncharacterized protein n=1 Tax=Avena sativa TaxID=4498 RepID=A0ACD5WUQ5_AVESA
MMLMRHWQIKEGSDCVLCSLCTIESRDHHFFACPFALSCWDLLNIKWDCSLTISQRFLIAKGEFEGPCFMEIVVCAAWNIWKERNELIFQGKVPSFSRWKVRFQHDLLLHQFRVKQSVVQPLLDWSSTCFT